MEGKCFVATIVDVARRAGVSVSTVSHVINGTRFVSPETKALVQSSIESLGFVPNAVARSLARASTKTIGVAVSTSTNSYFMDVVCAIEQACGELGQMVFLADTKDDPEIELKVVKALHQRRVDGIILAPSADPKRAAIRYLKENQVPCVLVDRLLDEELDQVGVTNESSMRNLTEHLIGLGHKRIAYVAGQPGFRTTQERIDGYKAALRSHGLDVDEAIIICGNATMSEAAVAAKTVLALPERPTAIISGNNLATIGVMQAIRAAGLKVPEDVAIAGFDDFEWADSFEPRLTVIAQPCAKIGHEAANLLARRIGNMDDTHATVRLEAELIIRESCGAKLPVGKRMGEVNTKLRI